MIISHKIQKIISSFIFVILLTACKTTDKHTKHTLEKNNIIPTDRSVKKGVLQNGLTYYLKKNPKPAQKLELRLVVKAGSILENEKQLGLAHFMEHMNFNGSKHFDKNELVDYLQSIGVKFGAHLNAYTSFDETVYILPIPTDDDEKLEKGFQILEDWAFNASLTEEEIDKERGVVLEEYRIGLGANKRMLQQYLPKILFNSHYAKRLPIGTKEVLENFSYEDLRSFYKTWYRPNLMSVVAVGDVDEKKLEKKIKEHFEKYTNPINSKERTIYSSPNHKETLVSICTDLEATRSTVQVYYKDRNKAKYTQTIEDYKQTLINHLFSEMINNRLNELKNLEKPPFIYAGSWYSALWDPSKKAYQSYAITSETGQLEALENIVTENKRVLKHGFTESELIRAKNKMINQLEQAFKEKNKTKSGRYAQEYIQNFLHLEPIPGIDWEYTNTKDYLNLITLKDCNQVIQNKIHEDNLVIVLTGPLKENIPMVTKAEVLAVLEKVDQLNISPYNDLLSDTKLMKNIQLTKGRIISTKKDPTTKSTTITLNNGAKVTYLKTDLKNDQILFSAFGFGGTSWFDDDEYQKTVLAINVLTEAGVHGFTKNDLSKILSEKQVNLSPFVGEIQEGFQGNSNLKDLETLFQLTYLYSTQLNFNRSAYNSYQNRALSYYNNALANPNLFFNKDLNEFLNAKNSRFVSFPTQENFEKTDFELAHQLFQKRFSNAGHFHFYFVGNFNTTTLKEYCKTYLANLPTSSIKAEYQNHNPKFPKGHHKRTVYKGNEPKSMVKIIFQGDAHNFSEYDHYYLKSLGELLTIKLVETLREDESGVYGVSAKGQFELLPQKRYNFTISFPCAPSNVDTLIKSALAELDKIKSQGVLPKDLQKIKETQLLEHKEATQENAYWLALLKNVDFYQISAKELTNTVSKIEQLQAKDLQNIAQKYLEENQIIAILKPEK